jgi:hypothetical protein
MFKKIKLWFRLLFIEKEYYTDVNPDVTVRTTYKKLDGTVYILKVDDWES